MMMMQGYGYGWLFQIVILILFFCILWWMLKGSKSNETASQILKRRLASGEITKREYKELKKEINGD